MHGGEHKKEVSGPIKTWQYHLIQIRGAFKWTQTKFAGKKFATAEAAKVASCHLVPPIFPQNIPR